MKDLRGGGEVESFRRYVKRRKYAGEGRPFILQKTVALNVLAFDIAETSLAMTHADCFDARNGVICVSKHAA